MAREERLLRARAGSCSRKPSSSIARWIRSRVSADTERLPLRAYETVLTATPERLAMSTIVSDRFRFIPAEASFSELLSSPDPKREAPGAGDDERLVWPRNHRSSRRSIDPRQLPYPRRSVCGGRDETP